VKKTPSEPSELHAVLETFTAGVQNALKDNFVAAYLIGSLATGEEEESRFPEHVARRVHDMYVQPVHEEFQPRTMWSLSNAFNSAFKELGPIPPVQAMAQLARFPRSCR
jgi:hypothetical protein